MGAGNSEHIPSKDRILTAQDVIMRLMRKNFGEYDVMLTCHGLGSVNLENIDDSFDFICADRICRVHSILAEFVGPRIARLRRADASYSSYKFPSDCSYLFDVLESLVSCLRAGHSIHVNHQNFNALLRLSKELENNELAYSLLDLVNLESVNLTGAVVLLREGVLLGMSSLPQFEYLRTLVAFHFHEEILEDLDLETVQLLLSSSFKMNIHFSLSNVSK